MQFNLTWYDDHKYFVSVPELVVSTYLADVQRDSKHYPFLPLDEMFQVQEMHRPL